ncbi:MAG: PAS domain S-box protein, partial [Candidatus Aminicenantales bacterium]
GSVKNIPAKNERGEKVGDDLGLMASDITRNRIQELSEKEEICRALMESSADFIYVINRENKVILLNRAAASLFGKEPADIKGQSIFDLFPKKIASRYSRNLKRVFESGGPQSYESKMIVGKEELWVSVSLTPVRDSEGRVVSILGMARNITDYKRSELKRSKTLAAAAAKRMTEDTIQGMIDPVMITDLKGKIVRFNKAFTDLLGWGKEAIGEPQARFVVGRDAGRMEGAFKKCIRKGSLKNFECTAVTKDKKTIPVLVSTTLINDPEGRPESLISVLRDITDRKQTEDKLKEYSEQLEEMVKERTKELQAAQERLLRQERLVALGQLAGGVSHDLRNPLGSIKNAVFFLKEALEHADPEVGETIKLLGKEVATCERIISSLLDFARPRTPDKRKVDINRIIQEELSQIEFPDNIEIVRCLDESQPIVHADPDQMARVFRNMITNAIQAMPQGGRLAIESRISCREWVEVVFADTGTGIPDKTREKVFEPLFTTKSRGVGLGLAVARNMIEGHGGTIEVKSQVGKGSAFTIRLPLSS